MRDGDAQSGNEGSNPLNPHAYLQRLQTSEEAPCPRGDFDAIFRRYAAYVSTVIYRTLGRRDGVEDLVQDVFIDAFRHIEQLDDPAAIKPWLARIAVRRVYRHLRKQRLRAFFHLDPPSHTTPEAEHAAPDASPEQRALLGQVFQALDQLPPAERLPWSLRYIEGMTLQEVSEACECSLSTTKRRLAQAEARLKKVMSP